MPWPRTAIRDGAMAGGTHLELEERERLAALKAEGLSLRAIARALGRAASTVSRELRRNALPRGGCLPVHAEGCYLERRQRQAVLERDARRGRFVRERLLEGWTPERIAGWLKRGEERGLRSVACETVYAFIHRAGQKGEKLCKLLPRGRARRGRRRAPPARNANGGRRGDLPRDLDLDALGDAELQEIILSHNLTPRKCLGFLTPLQALLKELGRDVQIRFA